jgi:hypothetical protein
MQRMILLVTVALVMALMLAAGSALAREQPPGRGGSALVQRWFIAER